MLKKIVIAMTVVLAIGLGVFLVYNQKMEEKQLEKYEDQVDELRPLNVKKGELEQQIETLDKTYEINRTPKATVQVIFTCLESDVYNVCYPIMDEFEYTGILALAWNQLPGMEGLISVEEFKELIDKGWEICIKWDVQTPLATWWPQVENFFVEQGLEMTKIAYFVTGAYTTGVDAQLQEKGMEVMYHHGEEGLPLIQTSSEEGIWHLGCIGLMGAKPKLRLQEAVANAGNVAYLVSFEQQDEKYDERSFRSMLAYFDTYEANKELLVLHMNDARQHYKERALGDDNERYNAYVQEREKLQKELEEVKKKIEKIKAQGE